MHIIGGTYKNRQIVTPKGLQTRPTSARLRGSLFNICQQEVEGSDFLDLFAGSGAMGLEALSRGARFSTFVDASRESLACIQRNLKDLAVQAKAQALQGDVFFWIEKLAKQGRQFDLIYADPPYEAMLNSTLYSVQVLLAIDQGSLLKRGGMLFIEEGRDISPETYALKTLHLKSSRRMGRSNLLQFVSQSAQQAS